MMKDKLQKINAGSQWYNLNKSDKYDLWTQLDRDLRGQLADQLWDETGWDLHYEISKVRKE